MSREEAIEIMLKHKRGEQVSTVLLNMAHAVIMRMAAQREEERN